MGKLTEKRVISTLVRSHVPLGLITDPRAYRGGRQQALSVLLRLMLVSFTCGKRTLRAMETLSQDLGTRMRRALGLGVRKVSDTTLYEAMQRTLPFRFKHVVVAQIKTELKRKGITNDSFAGGVVAYDGKKVAFGYGARPQVACLSTFAQPDNQPAWMLKTLRSCLVSSSVRPVLGQTYLDNEWGEATSFASLFAEDVAHFPKVFRYVTGDAGITSQKNAEVVRRYGKHYLFAVKKNSRGLYKLATHCLANVPVEATTCERDRGGTTTRWLGRMSVVGQTRFADAQQMVVVQQTHVDSAGAATQKTRYFITSIPPNELSAEQLLKLVRLHWCIENGPNWTSDVVLDEDGSCPCNVHFGPLVTSWLRVLAYNLMAIFRAHLPKEDNRNIPWWRVKELLYQMLLRWQPDRELLTAFV